MSRKINGIIRKKILGALLSIFALAIISIVFSDSAAAQTRVRFAKGRTTAVLKGKTRGTAEEGNDNVVKYLLRARRGQQMTVHLVSPRNRARFLIYEPDNGYLIDGTDWSGELSQSGDYEIWVVPTGSRDTTFTLEITIR